MDFFGIFLSCACCVGEFDILIAQVHLVWSGITRINACRDIFRTSSDKEIQALADATEGLTIGVLLASINLPIIVYPPIYLWVVILSAIVIENRRQHVSAEFNQSLNFSVK